MIRQPRQMIQSQEVPPVPVCVAPTRHLGAEQLVALEFAIAELKTKAAFVPEDAVIGPAVRRQVGNDTWRPPLLTESSVVDFALNNIVPRQPQRSDEVEYFVDRIFASTQGFKVG